MRIGVFDSGVGGKSFVQFIKKRFAIVDILYIEDKDNIPYGNKTPAELLSLTLPLFRNFEKEHCDAVLVACNTVTTNIIEDLRKEIYIPLVGVEPMVKSAAGITNTGIFAVCATPATLSSKRYAWLKTTYADKKKIIEPDCSNWAYMIEHNRQNELKLEAMVEELRGMNVDTIVLGCTHYHWIKKELQQLAYPDIKVIQPIKPVLDHLERVLEANF